MKKIPTSRLIPQRENGWLDFCANEHGFGRIAFFKVAMVRRGILGDNPTNLAVVSFVEVSIRL